MKMDSTNEASETVEIPIIIEKAHQIETISPSILQLDRFTELGIFADNTSSQSSDDSSTNKEVTFVVEEVEFTLPKEVLTLKSPLFADLFTQKPSSRYIITKITSKVFSTVLEFIKTSKISSELSEDATGILEAAHKV